MTSAAHQVSRTLKLGTATALQPTITALQAIEGVTSVEEEKGRRRLHVTYDFTILSWGMLCEVLKGAGLYTPQNWLARWRDGWRDQLDHNMRDNLAHRPACCSKPPPGAGRH